MSRSVLELQLLVVRVCCLLVTVAQGVDDTATFVCHVVSVVWTIADDHRTN